MIHEDDDLPTQRSWLSIAVKQLVDCEPLFILLMTCVGFLPMFTFYAIQQAQLAACHSECKNGLRQLGLALHNYQATHPTLPAPETARPADHPSGNETAPAR